MDPAKTIGLIGGMSWESPIVYYELIIPNKKEIKIIHQIIYDELVHGI